MKEIKKYTSIVRYGHTSTQGVLKEGDVISITEKVDGANASFTEDIDNPFGVSAYSRNRFLEGSNTLNGFLGWVNKNISPIKDKLIPGYRYIGEWTTPHKVKYKEEFTNTFLLFSIWDDNTQEYLSDDIVISEAERLGLQTVEYFYYGEFVSYDHLNQFVGKSNITETPDTGEGIVVKNVNYRGRDGKQLFVKLVTEKFAEMQKQKLPKNPNIDVKEMAVIKSVLTKPRVEKIMLKFVDENLLTRDQFHIENMGMLIKLVSNRVLNDMLLEESEILSAVEDTKVRKLTGKILPLVIKEVIAEYQQEQV